MPKQILFEDIRHEGCKHCIHNPNAEKPYDMKTIDLDGWTLKALDKLEKETGLNRNCVLCLSLRKLMAMPDQDLVKLLEASAKLKNR